MVKQTEGCITKSFTLFFSNCSSHKVCFLVDGFFTLHKETETLKSEVKFTKNNDDFVCLQADDKSLLARFYHADRSLQTIAGELDSFDGRAEPDRCSRLVSRLRQGQVRHLIFRFRL